MVCFNSVPPICACIAGANHRYLIEFSQFARVNIPNVWKGDRNPVKYEKLADLGIDLAALTWEQMPHRNNKMDLVKEDSPVVKNTVVALTMAEAKKGLALTFNVPPESIEITVRG